MSALSISAQADTQIAFVIRKGLQYAGVILFEALDPPLIAHKVFALVTLNRTPFFIGEVGNSVHYNHSPYIIKRTHIYVRERMGHRPARDDSPFHPL